MSCFPLKWLKSKRCRETASNQEVIIYEEGERGKNAPSSPVVAEQIHLPDIKVTFCNVEKENGGETLVGEYGGERRAMRPRTKKISNVSDISGYASLPSTSTLDVWCPRTLIETSSTSSTSTTFCTPQGSVHSEHSPTSSSEIDPQFPAVASQQLDLKCLIDGMEELKRMVERLSEVIERREREEKVETCGLQPVESLPDLSELPTVPCDRNVILWLVDKVSDWKFLARWLKLEENDISRIELDHSKSDREQCYQMFLKWKSVDPENYTYPVLGEALRQENKELFHEFVKKVQQVE